MELAKEDGFDCTFITRPTRAKVSHGSKASILYIRQL
jgi:hypothetical protein